MTPEDKIEKMRMIFNRALMLASAKGHDYSGSTDGMGNFRTFGWKGIVVRLDDKMQRLIQFCKQGELKVKTESVEDTLTDLINYAALTLIQYREENRAQSPAQDACPAQNGPIRSSAEANEVRGESIGDLVDRLNRVIIKRSNEKYARMFGMLQ